MILELTFIILAVLIAKGIGNNKPLYVCIFLALLIIIGNSLVTAHINRMVTFSKPLNTIVLIIGGYLLQGLLIYTSILTIKRRQRFKNPKFYWVTFSLHIITIWNFSKKYPIIYNCKVILYCKNAFIIWDQHCLRLPLII